MVDGQHIQGFACHANNLLRVTTIVINISNPNSMVNTVRFGRDKKLRMTGDQDVVKRVAYRVQSFNITT